MFGKLTKGIILILIVAAVLTLCSCFEQTFVLPSVEEAESVTISSGACKMNVNDSIEKFVKIFEGLKLAEVKKEDIFGEKNEKYSAALEEIEGAHHVVATLADEKTVEFYFTDDGEVYYLDGETIFASKSKIDADAALATAKVGEGIKLTDLINKDDVFETIMMIGTYMYPYSSTFASPTNVDIVFENYLDGIILTDDFERVAYVQANMEDRVINLNGEGHGFMADFRSKNDQSQVIADIFVDTNGFVMFTIGKKVYVSVENLSYDYDNIKIKNSIIFY